ncbi:MAG: hypothetical protein KJO28_05415 [Desulfofustis sp.]|nr:hypothetical protein [Desulfofustis sp.]
MREHLINHIYPGTLVYDHRVDEMLRFTASGTHKDAATVSVGTSASCVVATLSPGSLCCHSGMDINAPLDCVFNRSTCLNKSTMG